MTSSKNNQFDKLLCTEKTFAVNKSREFMYLRGMLERVSVYRLKM